MTNMTQMQICFGIQKMIEGGKGGGNTITGLHYEERIAIKNLFENLENYSVKKDELLYKGNVIGEFFQKHKLYKNLLEKKGINYKEILSKKLLPDDVFYNHTENTIYILECKFQKVAGSFDEKLQT